MNIKIGDYVRTKYGLIRKIEKIDRNVIATDISLNDYSSNLNDRIDLEEQIIKSSPNIIDLIEDGDYVNGYLIEKVYDVFEITPNKLKEAHIRYADEDFISQLYDTQIKSIVTKEQFSSMEYKL